MLEPVFLRILGKEYDSAEFPYILGRIMHETISNQKQVLQWYYFDLLFLLQV